MNSSSLFAFLTALSLGALIGSVLQQIEHVRTHYFVWHRMVAAALFVVAMTGSVVAQLSTR